MLAVLDILSLVVSKYCYLKLKIMDPYSLRYWKPTVFQYPVIPQADSKNPDQPAHLRRLIKAFAVRL